MRLLEFIGGVVLMGFTLYGIVGFVRYLVRKDNNSTPPSSRKDINL